MFELATGHVSPSRTQTTLKISTRRNHNKNSIDGYDNQHTHELRIQTTRVRAKHDIFRSEQTDGRESKPG